MLAKEAGYILSIDQASNLAGVSLWLDGVLQATTILESKNAKDPFSVRIQWQLEQLTLFLDRELPPGIQIEKVLFEGVRARLVMITVGAFLACPRISAKMHERHSFVESTTWKKWARDLGAVGLLKDIKGLSALRATGFPVEDYGIESEDVSDSVMIYKAWVARD